MPPKNNKQRGVTIEEAQAMNREGRRRLRKENGGGVIYGSTKPFIATVQGKKRIGAMSVAVKPTKKPDGKKTYDKTS